MKKQTKAASNSGHTDKQSPKQRSKAVESLSTGGPGTPRLTRVVQIELKSPLWPIPARSEAESKFRFASHAGDGLARLHAIVRKYGLHHAHPSFRVKHPGPNRRRTQRDKDNLSRFVDLHFPPGADGAAILKELRAIPDVAHAIEVSGYRPAALPTDPLLGTTDQVSTDPAGIHRQWYIFRCGIQNAWEKATGQNVVIADVDAGFFLGHEDLQANVDLNHAFNAVDGTTDVTAGAHRDHGTAVLGQVAAARNGIGMVGVAYSASLWPIQTDASNTDSTLPGEPVPNAIDWVGQQDASGKRIVILIETQTDQNGNVEQFPAVREAISQAIQNGHVVCVVAGNGDKDAGLADDGTAIPPTGSILVGATGYANAGNPQAGLGVEASNWGDRITVSAPGDPDNDVSCGIFGPSNYVDTGFGGTSGAAAKVAGVIALMLQANPNLTHDQVKQFLTQSGSPLNNQHPMGVFLNADAAVTLALQ